MTDEIDMPNGEIQVVKEPPSPMTLLDRALTHNVPAETLERLVALHERMEARAAEREFAEAFAAFKAACPPVPRRAENAQFKVTRDGRQESRRYASLEDIEVTVRPHLGKHGLSFRWANLKLDGTLLSIDCVVSHVGGHSISSSATLPFEAKSGANEQQKLGSAMTYAQRYSLIQALGLTTCDEDTDAEDPTTITEEQAATIEDYLTGGGVDRVKFLGWLATTLRVDSVSAIRASDYTVVINALKSKVQR